MNSITEFKREFSRTMRGYTPEEVDAAIEMLVSYGAELESANAEFAEVNDELIAENDKLAAENAQLTADLTAAQNELAAFREKVGEAKSLIAEARRAAEQLRTEAEAEAAQIRDDRAADIERALAEQTARCAAEEKRYAALCRKTSTLVGAVRALYTEQMPAIEALAASIEVDDAAVEPDIIAEPEPATVTFTPPVKKTPPPRVRRAAMAAIRNTPGILHDPAPQVLLEAYGESAIQYTIRVWTPAQDYLDTHYALSEAVYQAFRENGVKMTYPHINVHMQ